MAAIPLALERQYTPSPGAPPSLEEYSSSATTQDSDGWSLVNDDSSFSSLEGTEDELASLPPDFMTVLEENERSFRSWELVQFPLTTGAPDLSDSETEDKDAGERERLRAQLNIGTELDTLMNDDQTFPCLNIDLSRSKGKRVLFQMVSPEPSLSQLVADSEKDESPLSRSPGIIGGHLKGKGVVRSRLVHGLALVSSRRDSAMDILR